MSKKVPIRDFLVGEGQTLAVCAGPCVIESEDHAMLCAKMLKEIFSKYWMNLIFKSSYDKANRTSDKSFRGLGMQEGLRILEKIKKEFNLPIVTDVHSPEEARAAAEVCDVIQIPAFLCRQTDLLVAAAQTKAVVQVKKGQFLAPWDMEHVVNKLLSAGTDRIILVERGTCFGYNRLINDMTSIPIMKQYGFPVCFDATHSVQLPGSGPGVTGGHREFVPTLAKAAIASGANMLFIETHPNPSQAKSDAATMLDYKMLAKLLGEVDELYRLVSGWA